MNILATAPKPPYVQVASGTFTQANSRISLVDGTAFFDCGADLSAYAGLDTGSHEYLIKVYDDDGYSIQGYVGAVGGGETLGSNLAPTACCTDPNNDVDVTTGWHGANSATLDSIAGGETGNCLKIKNGAGAYGRALGATTTKTGCLIKSVNSQKNVETRILTYNLRKTQDVIMGAQSNVDWGTTTTYRVAVEDDADLFVQIGSFTLNATTLLDNVSLKALTDCAATGFHIISAQGGSTQNWQNVGASFDYNDAAGYGYKIYRIAI